MSSLTKLNKSKNREDSARRVANEWKKQFYLMREQRNQLLYDIEVLKMQIDQKTQNVV